MVRLPDISLVELFQRANAVNATIEESPQTFINSSIIHDFDVLQCTKNICSPGQ